MMKDQLEKVNVIKPDKWLSQVALLDDVSREHVQYYPMHTSCGKAKEKKPTEAREFPSNTYEFRCELKRFNNKNLPRILADLISANGDCYDGRPFFDTDHRATLRDGTSAVYSNDIVADPGKDGLRKALDSMLKIPGEDGGAINGEMYRPIVLVPNFSIYNEFLKFRNPFDSPCDFEIVELPELLNTEDPDASRRWYMINGQYGHQKAFIVRAPGEPEVTSIDRVHTHDALALSCTTYAGVAYGLPQLAIRCTF